MGQGVTEKREGHRRQKMPQKSHHRQVLEGEWKVAKMAQTANFQHSNKDNNPPIFFNMPNAINDGWSATPFIGVPHGYFSANHCNTKWLLNVMADGADFRLQRLLKQGRTRQLFQSDKYYQIIDQPSQYTLKDSLSRPMFHNKASLFMNCFGVAIYLHLYNALEVLSIQRSQKEPIIWHLQENYATEVYNKSAGDVLIFHYDYIVLKRDAYNAIPHLLAINWIPGDASKIIYRCRYYQYVTPFLDWVDVCRHVLRSRPTLQVSKVLLRLINSRHSQFDIMNLKDAGKLMVEYFELKKLTSSNFADDRCHGFYAGRKLLHNQNPHTPMPYVNVFDQQVIRPVMPNVVSGPRRFIGYAYYHDYENFTSLSQVLSVTEVYQQNRFFSCDRYCSTAKWHRDPLIFQIYNIINLRCYPLDDPNQHEKVLLREQNWSDIKKNFSLSCWFHRFDILNCVSLMFGILQTCILKNLSSTIVDRICRLLLKILASSELIEPFLMYSFYDTYFALTSLVNCVPGLQSTSVMRMMRRAPLLLTQMYSVPQIVEMFSLKFWEDSIDLNSPTIESIGEYLVSRKRVMSMQVTSGEGGEAISRTSAMGASGAVILFARDTEFMPKVSQAEEEAADNSKSDAVKKAQEELKHIREYRQFEIDFRYASFFGEQYRYSVQRPKMQLCETKTLKQNTEALFSLS